MYCPKCGSFNHDNANFCYKCGYSLVNIGSIERTLPQNESIKFQFGGFWDRFFALIIDNIIFFIFGLVFGLFLGFWYAVYDIPETFWESTDANPLSLIIWVIVSWFYFAYLESSEKQATLGKGGMHLMVTDTSGRRISFGRASVRFFGKILCIFTLGLGYLLIVFTEKKQGLHDLIAGTIVIKIQ